MTVPGCLVAPMLGGANIAEIEFSDSGSSTTDASSYTFSGKALGAALANRRIIVCLMADTAIAGRTISGVSVGGVAGSQVVSVTVGSGSRLNEIWIATVPTGTTGDVVVSISGGNINRCAIAVYRAVNISTTAYQTTTDNSGGLSVSVNVPANGIAVGSGYSVTTTAYNWTGLTEDVDVSVEAQSRFSAASSAFSAVQSGLTVSVNTGDSLCTASWGPT